MEKKYRYRKQKVNGQDVQIENPDPADLQNTLIKMANKRAFVDAVLKATGASRYFSQDMEDFGTMTGQFEKASSKQRDFIRKLFGNNTSDAEALAEISRVCGREVKTFEDIGRNEASKIIDVKKKSASGAGAKQGNGSGPSYPPDDDFFAGGYPGDYNDDYNAGAGGGHAASAVAFTCADCGAGITKAEHGYSTNKFGRPLCRNCQSAAKQSA
jgi:hypothetical protein